MKLEEVTPQMLDAAIIWQLNTNTQQQPGTRHRLVLIAALSGQFMEYLAMMTDTLTEGVNPDSVIATALSVGIEIGMALEQMQRRPQA
jgi:hypothetical protein